MGWSPMCRKAIRIVSRGGEEVPCGFCFECRARYARGWAIRCVHEASLHEESAFVTLTYDDEHLPEHRSLRREDVSKFMRRLRKEIAPKKVRFYAAGEYGEAGNRPHYHLLLFGHMPGERTPLGDALWRSAELERVWDKGHSSVGQVTMASAMYVAQYVMKKAMNSYPEYRRYRAHLKENQGKEVNVKTGEVREAEFAQMSRGDGIPGSPFRYGIGAGWFDRYGEEVERLETVRVDGAACMPPRYYDELLRKRDEAAFQHMKLVRARKSRSKDPDERPLEVIERERREAMARELIAKERLILYSRKVLHATAAAVYDS